MTVNWCLVALAFVLGLVITLAFMVRRVRQGAPVPSATTEADAAGGVAAAKLVDTEGDSDTEEVAGEPPYGEGSVRLAVASADGPSGYTIKGNEDSMLYHSPESPTFGRTIAEVWFRDVETAEAAGFNRWDSGKSQRGK
jgi:uncharacterized membrane protein ArfC